MRHLFALSCMILSIFTLAACRGGAGNNNTTDTDAAAIDLSWTGQATVYLAGDDGDIQSGIAWPNPRFTRGTGAEVDCVTDNLTGLMWIKTPDTTTRTWSDALNYANNLSHCGYTDWRVPNRKELMSLINYGQQNIPSWLSSQGFSDIQNAPYWTSTTSAFSTDKAWDVHCGAGTSYYYDKTFSNHYVWPVRAATGVTVSAALPVTGQTTSYAIGDDGDIHTGVDWPNSRFSIGTGPEADCVTDNLTGLVWVKAPDSRPRSWGDAIMYANNLTLCGHADWRLANIKEIESLVNFGQVRSADWLTAQGFSQVYLGGYWSSTTTVSNSNLAWYVGMSTGSVDLYNKTATVLAAWPVRRGKITTSETLLSAPADVIAVAGNGQVTLTWNGVYQAKSYNIYWSTTSGVKKTSGSKITNATSPYVHNGVTNGTVYYYVVTANNAAGESAESSEVSSIPIQPLSWAVSSLGRSIYGIAWSGDKYVSVGELGSILTSTDGSIWIVGSTGTTDTLLDITWGGNQFLAVGPNSAIYTSSNGIAWTKRPLATSYYLTGLAWSGSQFVAVGYTGAILTSPDGISWTARVSGTNSNLSRIIWSGNQFVTVGTSGAILTSTDGKSWSNWQAPSGTSLSSVAWSGNKFVAVGYSGTIISSTNGTSWTSCVSGTTNDLYGVSWSGSQFVAVGNAGTIVTSSDGITWTLRSLLSGNSLNRIIWSGTAFVAIRTDGSILTSTDGINWIPRTSSNSGVIDLYHAAWSGSRYVAVGFMGTIVTSTDLVTWTTGTSGTSKSLYSIAWSGSQFVAVGSDGEILTSVEGMSWVRRASGTSSHLFNVIWTGTQFVAVGTLGTILTSIDGSNWTVQLSGPTVSLYGISSYGSQIVVVGLNGKIFTSSDAITWIEQTSGTSHDLYDVAACGNKIIAVGSDFTIVYSSDGVTWTPNVSGSTRVLYGVACSGSTFVAVGSDVLGTLGMILSSPDGTTWVTDIYGSTDPLKRVIWTGNNFIAAGSGGAILMSQ